MAALGRDALALALAVALWGIAASIAGVRTGRPAWTASGRNAVFALAGLLTLAFAVLEAAFVRSDFGLAVVAGHSSSTTPLFYRLAAPWSSQEGSLLLWSWLLSLAASLALARTQRRPAAAPVAAVAQVVLLGLAASFVAMTVFLAKPFAELHPAAAEGAGLNPLLRHPSMMIHPPMLYSGYTLLAIPFAFAVGALVTGRTGAAWLRLVRPFALAAWLCLGAGIALGARWSYTELGWGGYWAWDPVENASLMPWLTCTAFLHSAMTQERRGMLKVWNFSLVLASGILAILGTFLVRSGILQSIHAFGASTLGVPFLVLIAVLVAGSVALVTLRARSLASEHRLDSLLSREALFLVNNLVLVGLCFVIFWGTFFPLISEALTGREASVGPPWFDRYTVPLALALVLLAAVGPLVPWRRASPRFLARQMAVPLALAAVAGAGLAATGGTPRRPLALAMLVLAVLCLAVVAQELLRGARALSAASGRPVLVALGVLLRRSRRRYGGYLAHAGLALLLGGIAASSTFQSVREVTLVPGGRAQVAGYEFRYRQPTWNVGSGRRGTGALLSVGAVVDVRRDGRAVTTLRPARNFYPFTGPGAGPVSRFLDGEPTSEVALKAGLRRDLWVAVSPDTRPLVARAARADRELAGVGGAEAFYASALLVENYAQGGPPASFRIIVSPLVTWIWIGVLVALAGGLVALVPPLPRAPQRVAAPMVEERPARELVAS
jgi:cytochrome c-type biogenesis protein CcmF